ncbi:MAG: hypothetical protein IJV37_05485 [Bacteroidales bacterium]|nr:hypothetical protein [Bacteroidales bacterium]
MSTANATSGASVPAPGLNPGQLVSAIDHLWMAARLIDTLRTELHVLPDEARVRTSDILEDVLDDLCDQRRECCEALYEVLRGTGAGAVEPLKEEEQA